MPEIKNNFTSGRMNKDLDERLLPKGEYRDALNIDITTSETGNVGTAQNVLGTERISTLGITGQKCIGSIADTKNDKIYWFIAGTAVDAVVEYNTITKLIKPVLVDVKSTSGGILNFQTEALNRKNDNLITGVNLIVDEDKDNAATTFLLWTDNKNEPKKINIERCKSGCATGASAYSTMTKLFIDGMDKGNILEEHITTIKKSPLNAPDIALYKTSDASRDQTRSTTATYTSKEGELTTTRSISSSESIIEPRPKGYQIRGATGITFSANSKPIFQEGDKVQLTASTTDTGLQETYTATLQIVSTTNTGSGDTLGETATSKNYWCDVISISSNLVLHSLTWKVELIQGDPIYELKFPRFAYRWKYADGEYSCFSPFSKVAFLPNQDDGFEYNPIEAHNLSMVNTARTVTVGGGTTIPFDVRPKDVVEIDVLYKESNNTNVYTVTTLKTKEDMDSVESGGDGYSITSEQVHALVPSNQLLRPWDNVPRMAKAQEITKNRVVYGNYLQNYNIPEEPSFVINVGQTEIEDSTATQSLKSIRNYQVGVVFLDKFGRQTPVLSNDSGAVKLDQSYAETANKLNVKIKNKKQGDLIKPEWATHYRYFIKEPSLEYYNLAMDRFYTQEGDHIWLSFPSAERNKIDEETYLILKKKHDVDQAPEITKGKTLKYKILDLKNEAPKSIRKRKNLVATLTTQFGKTEADTGNGFPEELGLYINIPYTTIVGTPVESFLDENPNELYIRIAKTGGESERYQLTSIEPINTPSAGTISAPGAETGYWKFSLKVPLGSDVNVFKTSAGAEVGGLSAKFYKEETEDLEEFDGRFFVKIKRDNDLDKSLLSFVQNPTYGVEHTCRLFYINYLPYNTNENDSRRQGRYAYANTSQEMFAAVGTGNAALCIDHAVFYKNEDSVGTAPWGGGALKWDGGNKTGDIGNPSSTDWFGNGTVLKNGVDGKRMIPLRWLGGNDGRSPSKTLANEDFIGDDEYNTYLKLLQTGTKFRFNSDPNGSIHEIVSQNNGDGYPNVGYNWVTRTGALRTSHKTNDSNHALRLKLTLKTTIDGVEQNNIGWSPLSPNSDGSAPIDQFGTNNYRNTMGWKIDNSGGASETIEIVKEIFNELTYSSKSPAIWETEPKESPDLEIYYEASKTYPIADLGDANGDDIEYMNCWSYGNGAESNRIRDDYNAIFVDKGPKVSSTLAEQYAEERRASGMIYSGIYNSSSGVNRLNQFIQAEKITKDVNPEYGSIQKLHTRDSDVLVLCEDKCLRVYANKDALYNADGSTNLLSSNRVLGSSDPFVGDYGISENPESFATHGFRSYFTDKRRGAVLRLSRDGLTNIAYKGMRDWFSDNLRQPKTILGSYDDKKDNYNLTLIGSSNNTISYTELAGGWTSFKSFIPQSALTLNNTYYSFYNGDLWEHNKNSLRNKFYGTSYDSTIKLIFNDSPSTIKNFKTLNYEGTTSRLYKTTQRGYAAGTDTTLEKEGWYCNSFTTGEQDGDVSYFINKEGKWFANLHGSGITTTDLETKEAAKEFKVQGIGELSSSSGPSRAGYHVKISVEMDSSDDSSDNLFAIPTSFTIDGTTYDNTVSGGYHVAGGASVSKNVIFTFEPDNANTADASVMKAADFAFVSESSSTVTNAVTDASVAFADTTSAYADDNKVTMTVPVSFTMPTNDQTIVVKITGKAKHVYTISGKWYSLVKNTSVPTASNLSGTAYSASGIEGETVTIDLDPSDAGVTTTTFTAATDHIFKEGSHPTVDLKQTLYFGSNYRVTETPALGSTGDISTKSFAITYKIPNRSVENDRIDFVAEAENNEPVTNTNITNYTIDVESYEQFETTIATSATSATQTLASTANLNAGMAVTGKGVPPNSLVVIDSVTSSTVVVLSESICTTAGDTYTFAKPNIISKQGEDDVSLKVYGDAGAKFKIYLTKDSDSSSLLIDSDGLTVSSIEGEIPAAGSTTSYYETLLDFPKMVDKDTSDSSTLKQTYTLKLEEIPGTSVFISPLSSPEQMRFVQYQDSAILFTTEEAMTASMAVSHSPLLASYSPYAGYMKRSLLEPNVPDELTISSVLTSQSSGKDFRFLDDLDTDGDGISESIPLTVISGNVREIDGERIITTDGGIVSFENLSVELNNTPAIATATLTGSMSIHKYGTNDDYLTLNWHDLIGWELGVGDTVTTSAVNDGVYEIPITLPTAAGTFEVSVNAAGRPDRFEILFDSTNKTSNNIADMSVVADSFYIGDHLRTAGSSDGQRGHYRTNAIGTFTMNKFMYVGEGGNATKDSDGSSMPEWDTNGTTSITISDAVIAGPASDSPDTTNAAWRDACDPDGDGEGINHDGQVGLTAYYYANASAFTSGTKTWHNAGDASAYLFEDDGNATLEYNKPSSTSTRAYIRITSKSAAGTTGWYIYGTRFTST